MPRPANSDCSARCRKTVGSNLLMVSLGLQCQSDESAWLSPTKLKSLALFDDSGLVLCSTQSLNGWTYHSGQCESTCELHSFGRGVSQLALVWNRHRLCVEYCSASRIQSLILRQSLCSRAWEQGFGSVSQLRVLSKSVGTIALCFWSLQCSESDCPHFRCNPVIQALFGQVTWEGFEFVAQSQSFFPLCFDLFPASDQPTFALFAWTECYLGYLKVHHGLSG